MVSPGGGGGGAVGGKGPIGVAVVGAKGNMGQLIVKRLETTEGIEVVGLVDPQIPDHQKLENVWHSNSLEACFKETKPNVAVDFTTAKAVPENVETYTQHKIPFVLGTTGWDKDLMDIFYEYASKAGIPAVISSNMSPPLVLLQTMLEEAADKFPGILSEFDLSIEESHQKTKIDVSGTAKKWAEIFQKLGIDNTIIHSYREEERGHGYHWYNLIKGAIGRDAVQIGLSTRVDGRETYVDGVVLAIRFLVSKEVAESEEAIFSMSEVLRWSSAGLLE
ncbi:MAG: hypothetical protein GTN40_01490 [Candidatus Aenigmarchaeota archaeon]|nr:hypothetical protein [Candidatus Aenigmarchaeota archaeon]